MSLEMREQCERCDAPLSPYGEAYICSYECTYCRDCLYRLPEGCPNCGGELVRRPKRPPQVRP